MAINTKVIVTANNTMDNKTIILDRSIPRVPEPDNLTNTITVSISSPGGQQLSCTADVLDFLNAVKSAFPELLINLSS